LGNLVFIIPKSALLEQPSKTAGSENFSLGKDCVDNIESRYYNEIEGYRLSILKENRMSKEPLKVLTESMFYVLLSLLRQDRCGTEIVQYVDDTTAGRVSLGPGTLYTILAKFEEEGLIRETAVEGRKRTYAITDRGRALYRQELSRLRLCVADGEREEC
jgi:DNA-binding MarR family transcriptional regulator